MLLKQSNIINNINNEMLIFLLFKVCKTNSLEKWNYL